MKTEIQTKLEIASLLVKHLGNIDVSEAITPLQEYIKEQLRIGGVVKSLPSKNALTVKAWVEAKEHKLNNEKVDLKAYAFGFVDGGEWVKSEAK